MINCDYTFGKAPKPITGMYIQRDGVNTVKIDCKNGVIKSGNKIYDTNEITKIGINDENNTTIIFILENKEERNN